MSVHQTDAFVDTDTREYYPSEHRERISTLSDDARIYFQKFQVEVQYSFWWPDVEKLAADAVIIKDWIANLNWALRADLDGYQAIPGFPTTGDFTTQWYVNAGEMVFEYDRFYRLRTGRNYTSSDLETFSLISKATSTETDTHWASDGHIVSADLYCTMAPLTLIFQAARATADKLQYHRVDGGTSPTDARFSADFQEWENVPWAPSGSAGYSSEIKGVHSRVITPKLTKLDSYTRGSRARLVTKSRPAYWEADRVFPRNSGIDIKTGGQAGPPQA
jgi:hypothetical protein